MKQIKAYETLTRITRKIVSKKKPAIAVALSFALLTGVVFAAVVIPQLNRNPSNNPWDYALVSFSEGEVLTSAANALTVEGDIRSNGDIKLSGGNANISGFAIAGGSITSTVNSLTVGEQRENLKQINHEDAFENIYEIAGGNVNYYHNSTVVYDMQADSNLSNLRNNHSIPFMRGVGSSSVLFAVNTSSSPKTVTVTNRGGTSQGIQIIVSDINAIAKPNHLYKIEYSGIFPNNPTATARIRIENPTGATLATVDAINGEFTLSVTRTAEEIAADAQADLRYSLGNSSGNIDIVYTGILITEIALPPAPTIVYDMQTDSNLSDFRNNHSIPFMRGAGNSSALFTVNTSSNPKTVTVANRGGTSQGIQIIAGDINAIAKPNHSYKIEYSGIFPNNPTATARIRIENPTGATLATVDAVNGEFTLSITRTAEEIASDAQADLRYSLGNTSGNIDIVYTGVVITEIPPPSNGSTDVYDMQTDLNLSDFRNNHSIPFMRGVGSSSVLFAVNTSSSPKTVTVTNRGGTSQGIQIIVSDINAIAKPNHLYKIEYSGIFPNNPTATARIRIENPTGATLATVDAINGEFTLSVTRTAEEIAADAQADLRYSLGNTSGNIDIVYTGVVITEIPVIYVADETVCFNQHVVSDSAISVSATNDVLLNAYLLSESDIQIHADYLGGGETSKSVIASRNGNIAVNVLEIDFNGIVYAPNGKVIVTGSGTINGRIFAQEIEIVSHAITIIAGDDDLSDLGFTAPELPPDESDESDVTTSVTDNTEPPITDVTIESTTAVISTDNSEEPTPTSSSDNIETTVPVTNSPEKSETTVPDTTVSTTTVTTEDQQSRYSDVKYEYDSLGRLIKVIYDEENYIEYEYDANGNITKVITVIGGIIQQ